jgi:putative ABC transport system substrate-binding protein
LSGYDGFSWPLAISMKRRQFITLLGGAAAWPLVARAQQAGKLPVVGFLGTGSPGPYAPLAAAFLQGLKERGYVEGQNVAIDYRWGESQDSRLPALAADLVRKQVAVIAATGGDGPARAAQAAATTIPIVFQTGGDPVQEGLVGSLARPTGNLTGVTLFNVDLVQKRLELLHELVPKATVIAALVSPTNPSVDIQSRELQAAASALRVQLSVLRASSEREIDTAFETLVQMRAGALLIGPGNLFTSRSEQLPVLRVKRPCRRLQFSCAGLYLTCSGCRDGRGAQVSNFSVCGTNLPRPRRGGAAAPNPTPTFTREA